MAETWRIVSEGLLNTGGGYPLSLWNEGSNVLRLYRAGYLNTASSGYTGVVAGLSLVCDSGAFQIGGTSVTPVSYDSANTALDAVVAYTYSTITPSSEKTIRRGLLSTDEGAISVSSIDEWESSAVEWFVLFDSIGDSDVQPLVIRNGESCALKLASASYAGRFLFWMEFTNEGS